MNNFNMVLNVKYIFSPVRLIFLFFTLNSCSFLSLPDNVKPITPNSIVSAKGIVEYFLSGQNRVYPGTINHSGYILKYPIWDSSYEEEQRLKFIEPDSIAKKYEGKKVYVRGLYKRIPTVYSIYENEAGRKGYDVILIDTIYVIR